MKRGLAYLLVGLLALLVFLAARLPAAVAYGWLDSPSFSLANVEGTVWRGRAGQLHARGVSLGETQWQFRFSALFRGRLAYRVATQLSGFPIDGIAATGFGGDLHLRKFQGRFPLQALRDSAPELLTQLAPNASYFDCAITFDLARVDLVEGWPAHIDAQVIIEDLQLLTMRPPLALGSFEFSFAEQDTFPGVGQITDTAGPLDVEGTLSLDENRCYQLDGSAAARADAPSGMQQVLAFLGPAGADGRHPLRRAGCL